MKKTLLILVLLAVPFYVFAEGIVVPDGDPFASIMELFKNWAALSPFAKGAAAIVVFVQLVKKFMPSWKFTKISVVVGGILMAILQSMSSGMSAFDAMVYALITCGGAVALYQLFKTPLNAIARIKG